MENRLADESGARSGYVIPLPAAPVADDTEDDPDTDGPLTALKKDLAKSRGGVDISLSFNSLMGHDVAGRAAAFKGMIAGGMPIERAVALSGLLALEE